MGSNSSQVPHVVMLCPQNIIASGAPDPKSSLSSHSDHQVLEVRGGPVDFSWAVDFCEEQGLIDSSEARDWREVNPLANAAKHEFGQPAAAKR